MAALVVVDHRQHGEGARGQEVFVGDALVRLFVGQRADDPGLGIVPAGDLDPGVLPQARVAPLGGDDEARRDLAPVGKPRGDLRRAA